MLTKVIPSDAERMVTPKEDLEGKTKEEHISSNNEVFYRQEI